MSEGSDRERLHAVFRPPASEAIVEVPRSPYPSVRLVRLHLLAFVLALVVQVVATVPMQGELFDAAPTWPLRWYADAYLTHTFSLFTMVVPALAGVLPLLLSLGEARVPTPWPRWLPVLALAGWVGGMVCYAIALAISVPALAGWGTAAILLADLVYLLGAMLGVLAAGPGRAWRSLLASATTIAVVVNVALFYVVEISPSLRPYLGSWSVGPTFAVAAPLLLAMLLASIEPRRLAVGARAAPRWATAVVVLGMLLSPFAVGALALPVLVLVLLRAARPLLVGGAWTKEPAALAKLLALVTVVLGAGPASLLGTLSVDVHLHDTYFVVALDHVVAATLLLLLLGSAYERSSALLGRVPHRGLAIASVVGIGGGFGLGIVAMLALGQAGMPQRYPAYVPELEPLHRAVGAGGLLVAVGLLLVGLALATGRRDPIPSTHSS